jgi:gamma-glutamylcysteine synthetase
MSQANNNFSGANFPGVVNFGENHGTQIGIQHNYAQEQNLAEAAKEIQDLLTQLQQNNPTVTEAQKQATIVKKVEQHIRQNPTVRDRLLNALKQGGIKALEEALNAIYKNSLVSISVETVKGFLEAECSE